MKLNTKTKTISRASPHAYQIECRPNNRRMWPELKASQSQPGFTLLEIMIVIIIIGLLAILGMPSFQNARTQAQATRLANDFKKISGAFENYSLEEGQWPGDEGPGVTPAGMSGYVSDSFFANPSALQGEWDWEGPGAFAFSAGISLRNSNASDELMRLVDSKIDDGDLASGSFRSNIAGGGFTYILEE